MTDQVEALLFDLGNVLVRIDFARAIASWSAATGVSAPVLAQRFSFDEAYRQHERDEIDAAQYFASLRGSLGVTLDDPRLTEGWNAIFVEEEPGIAALLDSIDPAVPLYAFSNSNRVHFAHCEMHYASLLARFRQVFVSWRLGARKPEARAFGAVAERTGVAPGRILFFDDTPENVHGARAAGMQAVHVRSITDVHSALDAHALLRG